MNTLRAGPLVDTDWLAANLDDDDLRVVDASYHLPVLGRDAAAEYADAHIAGAVPFDIDDIAAPDTAPLKHMLPDADRFAARVGALGIGNRHHVVAYDTLGIFSAPRVWWMFREYGHDRVSVLDGGLPKWLAEGRPTEAGAVSYPAESFTVAKTRGQWRSWRHVRDNMASNAAQLVEARRRERYDGAELDPYPGVRLGHIPGSVSLPFPELIDPDTKTLLPAAELRRRIEAAGIDPARPIISSCGSGVTACILALGLHLNGFDDWAIYDGSWSEWGARDDLPIAT